MSGNKNAFRFVDIKTKAISEDIESLFPNWEPGNERVVILSPHDDDAILGAGHTILAAQAFGADVHLLIFCNGCLGYSKIEEKDTIVPTRKQETITAYTALGIPEENIHRFWIGDLAVWPYLGWNLPDGTEGMSSKVIHLLRDLHATRVLVPNGYREHIDHTAVATTGAWDVSQVGDPIVAEYGFSDPVKSTLQYSVWGNFSPDEALVDGRDVSIRANAIVLCERSETERLNEAIYKWQSQMQIIAGLIKAREARRYGDYMMELYIKFDPRPALDYSPYAKFMKSTFGDI